MSTAFVKLAGAAGLTKLAGGELAKQLFNAELGEARLTKLGAALADVVAGAHETPNTNLGENNAEFLALLKASLAGPSAATPRLANGAVSFAKCGAYSSAFAQPDSFAAAGGAMTKTLDGARMPIGNSHGPHSPAFVAASIEAQREELSKRNPTPRPAPADANDIYIRDPGDDQGIEATRAAIRMLFATRPTPVPTSRAGTDL